MRSTWHIGNNKLKTSNNNTRNIASQITENKLPKLENKHNLKTQQMTLQMTRHFHCEPYTVDIQTTREIYN